MNNFEKLSNYIIHSDELLKDNVENQRDFINTFIINYKSEERKIVDLMPTEDCMRILNINFYDSIIMKNGELVQGFGSMSKTNQIYYRNIKESLLAIYIRYIRVITPEDFDFNLLIEIAGNIKDIGIDTNTFILDVLLYLSYINTVIDTSPEFTRKVFHFYDVMKKRLGYIYYPNLQARMHHYNEQNFNISRHELSPNEEVYPTKNLPNRPNIPNGYERQVAKKRNNTINHVMKSTATPRINIRPTLKSNILSEVLKSCLNPHNGYISLSNIDYPVYDIKLISRISHRVAINAGGPSRAFYNDMAIHFTNSVQLKKVYNLNTEGVPKIKIKPNRSIEDAVKNIVYVPYIENVFTNRRYNAYLPKKSQNGSIVELSSDVQLVLNIMFFVLMCGGANRRQSTIGKFTIKDSYLSRIFICYSIVSRMKLLLLPQMNKNIYSYQLYSLLTAENNESAFGFFKQHMTSLYCAINNIDHPVYGPREMGSLKEQIEPVLKILNHFINRKLKVDELGYILNEYYFNQEPSNYTNMTINQLTCDYIHQFMLNHIISAEVSDIPEDKTHIKRISNIRMYVHGLRTERVTNIIHQFIDSLNNEEIKIFVTCLTGSSTLPTSLDFAFNDYRHTTILDTAFHFHTCSKNITINYDFTGQSRVVPQIDGYNPTESVVYDLFITHKTELINIMRGILSTGGFQYS